MEDAELGIQSCDYRSGKDMEEYLQTNPDSPLAADIYWNKGQEAFAAGDFLAAAKAFERVTLDFPESEDELGDYRQAFEAYGHALDAGDAPVAEIRYRQGECREKDGKMDEALASDGQAASDGEIADPFRIASLARLAEVFEERGDWTAATGYWQAIADAGGKPEWTQMATDRLAEIKASGMSGS